MVKITGIPARIALIIALGIVISVATYLNLGKTAGTFFGFVYILAIPFAYELLKRAPRGTV